jgi:hypothetical protein
MTRGELERIRWGPEPGQSLGGLGSVRIIASCPGDAEQVLRKAKEVMAAVASVDANRWPSTEHWRELLPHWFVERCPPEPSEEFIAKMLSMPPEGRRALEDRFWDVESWVHWFRPENRVWSWWDATAIDDNTLVIALEVTEWPFPWGSLKWLLRAAGATSVEAEQ